MPKLGPLTGGPCEARLVDYLNALQQQQQISRSAALGVGGVLCALCSNCRKWAAPPGPAADQLPQPLLAFRLLLVITPRHHTTSSHHATSCPLPLQVRARASCGRATRRLGSSRSATRSWWRPTGCAPSCWAATCRACRRCEAVWDENGRGGTRVWTCWDEKLSGRRACRLSGRKYGDPPALRPFAGSCVERRVNSVADGRRGGSTVLHWRVGIWAAP